MSEQRSQWIEAAQTGDVPDGGMLQTVAGGELLCLYNLAGRIYATQAFCTHGGAELSLGYIVGDDIECPLHQGCFHIPSGRATREPCSIDLRVYPVRIENGVVLVYIAPPA